MGEDDLPVDHEMRLSPEVRRPSGRPSPAGRLHALATDSAAPLAILVTAAVTFGAAHHRTLSWAAIGALAGYSLSGST